MQGSRILTPTLVKLTKGRVKMKYLRQFGIILAISFLGEFLRSVIPLPIPASVYGLVCMLGALKTGLIKVHQVRETAKFLIDIMPVMFIPAAVGLLNAWGALKPVLLPVAVITIVVTVLVMAVTGTVTQYVMRRKGGNENAVDYE